MKEIIYKVLNVIKFQNVAGQLKGLVKMGPTKIRIQIE